MIEQAETKVKEHRKAQREAMVYKVLSATMAALTERGLRYVALLVTAGLFGWAMFDPLPIRTVTAGIFALVFVVVLFKKGGGDGTD